MTTVNNPVNKGQAGDVTSASPSLPQKFYAWAVAGPVERWYIRPLGDSYASLTATEQISVYRQAVVGWLQSLLFIIMVVQSLFAGALRALPPDLRAAVGFLHRIEWGVYLGMASILVLLTLGWQSGLLLTNRFYLLGWRLGNPLIIKGGRANRARIVYAVLLFFMIIATIWVRINGFIVKPVN